MSVRVIESEKFPGMFELKVRDDLSCLVNGLAVLRSIVT